MGSNYLFSMPSFLSGAARTLDLAGQFDEYNSSPSPMVADARALASDMIAVGQDLRSAMVSGGQEQPKK
jgi:hypothetical protein